MYDTRDDLLGAYRATPVTLRVLVSQAGEASIKHRPADDAWSIIEVVAHLVDAEELVVKRIERMLTEDDPALPAYDPDELAEARAYRARDLAQEVDLFESVRMALAARLEGLDAAGWQRTGQHEEVGEITVEGLTAHMSAHDAVHLAQIARILTVS